jgi:hypothetical protein
MCCDGGPTASDARRGATAPSSPRSACGGWRGREVPLEPERFLLPAPRPRPLTTTKGDSPSGRRGERDRREEDDSWEELRERREATEPLRGGRGSCKEGEENSEILLSSPWEAGGMRPK